MKLFKKKKIYKVEFRDTCDEYGCVLVYATDSAKAWLAAKKQFSAYSIYRPVVCIAVTEMEEV